jgi:hypothetical protein
VSLKANCPLDFPCKEGKEGCREGELVRVDVRIAVE